MQRQRIVFLIVVTLCFALVGLAAMSQRQQTPVAAAAGQTFTLYLPLVTRACTSVQLIQDGSFEATDLTTKINPSWQTSSNKGSKILDNSSVVAAHTGTWLAFLGGSDFATEGISQTLTVPTGVTSLQIVFWRQVNTTEPVPFTNDSMIVQIKTITGTIPIKTLYDGDVGSDWVKQTLQLTPGFANQSITLGFIAQTDTSHPTSFFIDDVSVQTCQ